MDYWHLSPRDSELLDVLQPFESALPNPTETLTKVLVWSLHNPTNLPLPIQNPFNDTFTMLMLRSEHYQMIRYEVGPARRLFAAASGSPKLASEGNKAPYLLRDTDEKNHGSDCGP